MSENLLTEQPQTIEGTFQREGLQYYLQTIGANYAVRLIDVHGKGLGRSSVGKRFQAEVITDPTVTPPKGCAAYCYNLKEINPPLQSSPQSAASQLDLADNSAE